MLLQLWTNDAIWTQFPANNNVVITRFLCSIVLHVQLASELKHGLDNMKYAVNHQYKFYSYKAAWACGFMQAVMVFYVEGVAFIALLNDNSVVDIVMNFLALVVIAQFDEFVYEAIS